MNKLIKGLKAVYQLAHNYFIVEAHFGCGLATAVGAAAYTARLSGVIKLDLSEQLAELIRSDNVSFLNRIGASGFAATQEKHSWVEDKLNPNTAEGIAGATSILTASDVDTELIVASGQGSRFKIGTLFKNAARNKTEVMRVTLVANDTLTIERGHGTTSAEAHASAFSIMIIGHTKQEGWKPTQEDWTQERSEIYNYLTTMGLGVTISRRRQAIDHPAIASDFAHQTAYRIQEFMRSLDSSLINSIRSASSGSSTDYSSLGGLLEFASQATGNINSTAEAISPAVVNAMARQIWDDGGMVAGGRLFFLVGGFQKQQISTFDQAYRRTDFDAKTMGYVVERFITDLGFELEVIVDPWMPADTIVIGDANRIKMGPLQTDAIGLEDIAKTGRVIEAMVSGSYTAEFRNAIETLAFHSNLSIS